MSVGDKSPCGLRACHLGRLRAQAQQIAMFGETESPRKTNEKQPAIERPSITRATVVDDDRLLQSLVSELKKADFIAFDTETTGTDPLLAELVGIYMSEREGEGYYLPAGHREGQQL